MFKFIKGFFGQGFKPANNLADAVVARILESQPSEVVSAPWINRAGLNQTGKLAAIASISGRAFGVAKSGSAYKFYYRRSLTGVWLAEVWSVWKSVAIAAPLVVAEMSVANVRAPSMGFAQLVVGLIIAVVFLPRGVLSVGSQYSITNTIARESYGPSGLLNLAVGLYGVNAVWASFFKSWHPASFAADLLMGKVYYVGNSFQFYLISELPSAFAVMTVGAFAFWAVAFKHIGARACAEKVFNQLRVRANAVYALYPGSDQERATVLKAPQVALGALAYVVLVLGLVNRPLIEALVQWW